MTLEPSDATTRVVVTSERAFVEPFGITVRPCLLGAEGEQTLAGICPVAWQIEALM